MREDDLAITLVVVRPFGPYAVGHVLADPVAVRDTLFGPHVHDVVRVSSQSTTGEPKEEN